MKQLFIISILSILFCLSANAQVKVFETPPVMDIMQRYTAQNKSSMGELGWRVQILSTTDRREMENEKQKFMNLYPHLSVSWDYKAPYYRLRVGAFKKKIETAGMIFQIKKDYPAALPVKDDEIKPVEFL